MDFLDPVDILPKLPASFGGEEGLESKKWQERRDALQALHDLIAKDSCLCPKANYGELVSQLNKALGKDANINVQALAAKCITGVAAGLRKKFAPHAPTITPTIFEKFKEKKPLLRDPLIEAIDAVYASTTIEALEEAILAAMENKNPQIKSQTDQLLYRAFKKFNAQTMPKKTLKSIVPILMKHTADADIDVRTGSFAAIGSAMRAIGPAASNTLFKDISEDKTKMAKITEFLEKATAEVAEEQAAQSAQAGVSASSSTESAEQDEDTDDTQSASAAAVAEVEIDPFDLLAPVDVLAKLPANFYGEEGTLSKKWTERRDALQVLLDLITANPKLDPKANYGELVQTLNKILGKDANINVAALAAKCLGGVANGIRKKFAPHVPTVIGTIFEKFKEKKPTLKEPLIECVDVVGTTVDLESIEEGILSAMDNKNPQIKSQTDLFIYRVFKRLNTTTMPKKTLKALAPLLTKHTSDSDAEVRDAAYAALGAAMRVVTEKVIATLCGDIAEDKIKMAKIKEFCQKVTEECGPVASAAPPPPAPKKAEEKKPAAAKPPGKGPPGKPPMGKKPPSRPATPTEEEEEAEPEKPPSRPPSAAGRPAAKKAPPKKEEPKEEEVVEKKSSSLLMDNDEKAQRIKDEAGLKLLKWNFTLPTEEHVQQLQTLLGQFAKTTLSSMLFHKDFKQHVKAIEELNKIGDSEPNVLVSNSDLLLKWCTLRFFETNPAVLIKTLELALRILKHCQEFDVQFSNVEVSSFLPYLIIKSGEPKENMRTVVRDIIDVMTDMCGPYKLAPALLDGLKTKNARQRTEVLQVLQKFIEGGALSQLKAMNPHPIKLIAACVSDPDKNVRSAAINGMVAAYGQDGEAIWKIAGKMADKERQMVDERIKRSGTVAGSAVRPAQGARTGGAKIVKGNETPLVRGRATSRSRPGSRPGSRMSSPDGDEELPAHVNSTFNANSTYVNNHNSTMVRSPYEEPVAQSREIFSLDSEFATPAEVHLRRDREGKLSSMNATLNNFDATLVNPDDLLKRAPAGMKRTNSQTSIASSVETLSENIDRVISDIASAKHNIAYDAISQLVYVVQEPAQKALIVDRVDIVIQMCYTQLQYCRKATALDNIEDAGEITRCVYNFLGLAFMDKSNEQWHISACVLEKILNEMTGLLSDANFRAYSQYDQLARAVGMMVQRVHRITKPSIYFEAVMNNVMNNTNADVNDLLLKLLFVFVKSVDNIAYIIQMDLKSFFQSANDYYHFVHNSRKQTELIAEVMDQMNAGIERVVTAMREKCMDEIRRITRPHPKMVELVQKVLQSVKNTPAPQLPQTLPGEVEASVHVFSVEKFWSTLHQIAVDFTQIRRTVPPLAAIYKAFPDQQQFMKNKISQYFAGESIWNLVDILVNGSTPFDVVCAESTTLFEYMNMSRDTLLSVVGESMWGERKNPLIIKKEVDNGNHRMLSSTVSLSSELPEVTLPVAQPTPVVSRPQIKSKSRRSMLAKDDLNSIKERLNSIGRSELNGN